MGYAVTMPVDLTGLARETTLQERTSDVLEVEAATAQGTNVICRLLRRAGAAFIFATSFGAYNGSSTGRFVALVGLTATGSRTTFLEEYVPPFESVTVDLPRAIRDNANHVELRCELGGVADPTDRRNLTGYSR